MESTPRIESVKKQLISTYQRLLKNTPTTHHRYLFKHSLDKRLCGIIGARGTGKTTLMLQHIKERLDHTRALYFSADHLFFSQSTLFEYIQDQYEIEEIRYFFIDEIHKYPNWNQELKNIYDSFPDIQLTFSGSSSIDLIKGSHDLSRRALLYRMTGMSFREFLLFEKDIDLPTYSFEQILASHPKISEELSDIPGLRKLFSEYLAHGYYPFYFEDKETFSQRILSIIEKTIYEDIASFYKLKTENLPHLKRMLIFLATIKPGEVNTNNIAKAMQIDNKTVVGYLEMLEGTGLIRRISIDRMGGPLLRKPDKIFLNNTSLYNAIAQETGREAYTGTVRETFFLSMLHGANHSPHYATSGDYTCNDITFEIGGKNKGFEQVSNMQTKAFVVKDDILQSDSKRSIPLYLWGFLY